MRRCHVRHSRPPGLSPVRCGPSDDRLTPRRVDVGVTLRKYGSAIIGIRQTGPRRRPAPVSPAVPAEDRHCGVDMAIAEGTQPAGIVAVSRAVVSAAAELVAGVERVMVGDDNVRTAQRNAWAAIQADRARAQARDEMNELVAALLANRPRREDLPSRYPEATAGSLVPDAAAR